MTSKDAGPLATTTRLLLSCGVVAAALILGLAAAGGTLAALADSETVPGATITAGSLDLTVNGTTTAALGRLSVVPATPQAFTFTVANTGTAPVDLTTTIAVTSSTKIADNFKARLTPVANAAACVPGLNGTQGPLRTFTAAKFSTLAAGQSQIVCLELALDAATPVTLSGQNAAFTATITATQKGR